MKDFNENQQEKGTSLIKSMPQSAQNDTYLGNNFCKNTKKSIKNVSFLRKPRVFKVIAASGLALFMGVGVLCGVLLAPMNSVQTAISNQSNFESTNASSIITPKEDDPVICDLIPGIEIKWGKMIAQGNPANMILSSGYGNENANLVGFPYFSTFVNGVVYNWVIIGMSESCQFIKDPSDPAGLAIYQEAFNVPRTSKINEGMLCLANTVVAQGVYNTSYRFTVGTDSRILNGTYTGHEDIASTMESYYKNGSFGLNSLSPYIEEHSLSTYSYTANYFVTGMNKDSIGQSASTWKTYTATQHMFPLASNSNSTFYYGDYLTADQLKLSEKQWLRGNEVASTWSDATSSLNADGTFSYISSTTSNIGYRPAFVLDIS